MAKLNINITDNIDLITQAKNLTLEQQKEAQIARLYLNQCKFPVYSEGASGRFVMLDNAVFKSTTMKEAGFMMGLIRAGYQVGISESDIMETYSNDAIAMALCNHIQKKTAAKFENMSADQINAVSGQIEKNLSIFGKGAREAKVNLGVVLAAEQQVKKDLEKLKELASQKEEGLNEKQ